jgi:hypothetical protein
MGSEHLPQWGSGWSFGSLACRARGDEVMDASRHFGPEEVLSELGNFFKIAKVAKALMRIVHEVVSQGIHVRDK